VSLIRRAAGALLPVGSTRRSKLARTARDIGLLPTGKLTEYERWITAVEPWQFSSPTDHDLRSVAARSFHIDVRIEGATSADLERTVLSLGDQIHTTWTASVSGINPVLPKTLARLRQGESRFVEQLDHASEFSIAVDAGDVLAPAALFEIARVITPTVLVVTADHDSLTQFGDRRTNPRRHHGADVDALRQFDPCAGLVARRASLTDAEVLPTILRSQTLVSPDRNEQATTTGQTYVHLRHILLHRRWVPGPVQRVLPGTDAQALQSLLPAAVSVQTGAADFGTQVRDRNYGSTPIRVGVVVLDGFASFRNRQRSDLSASVNGANSMFAAMAVNVSVALSETTLSVSPPANEIVEALEALGATVGFVIDGSLRIQSPDLFADLVGIVCRGNVFGVAPMIVGPSGVAIDAGLEGASIDPGEFTGTETLIARCGPLRQPPYSLLWTRSVPALSGRCLMAPIESFRALDDRSLTPASLRIVSAMSKKALLVWPHHQVVFSYGITAHGNTPAVLPWRDPRLMTWFGPDIAAYSPLNDSASESVW
jgi:hypothetical protein